MNKILVSDLPCLFGSLVEKYRLGPCDDTNCDKKYWRRASGNKANERVKIFAKYFSELFLLIHSLDNYSICVRHYNQIITSNVLLEKLKAEDNSISSSPEGQRKRSRAITIDEDAEIPQQDQYHTDLLLELEKTKDQLNKSEDQRIEHTNIINGYQQRINEQESDNKNILLELEATKDQLNQYEGQQIEYMNNISEYQQRINEQGSDNKNLLLKLEKMKNQLNQSEVQRVEYMSIIIKHQQRINELELQNSNLLSENKKLKEKWNDGFNDQLTRIESIREIAKKERQNLYHDIMKSMRDQKRFGLDNLLSHSTSEWLAEQNPVITEFVKTIVCNENENQPQGEKLFKCSVVIDAIYGARNLKYVSAINLASSAIKYSIVKSKKIIDIDNQKVQDLYNGNDIDEKDETT